MSWGDPNHRYDLESSTKAIGVTALGLALLDGKMKLTDKAIQHHPGIGVPPEGNRTRFNHDGIAGPGRCITGLQQCEVR